MKLSIVTTAYHSAPYLKEFYRRITKTAKYVTNNYEIIIVNDGSPDNSLEIILSLFQKDPQIKIIDLSRNFGHHKAIMTGLSYTQGDYVYLTDCDLEEPPELLLTFWKEMNKIKNVDVIFGKQTHRVGGKLRKFTGKIFYKIFNLFSDFKLSENLIMTRLMRRGYVKAIIQYKETDMVFAGICVLAGFNQLVIPIERKYKGRTTYTFAKKMKIMIDSIISFSERPLIYISYIGLFAFLISIFLILRALYQRIILGRVLEGWTSLVVSVWFFGGAMIFCLSILGIYVARIYIQTKNRPFTIIKKVYQRTK